jgi:hypothetical protein
LLVGTQPFGRPLGRNISRTHEFTSCAGVSADGDSTKMTEVEAVELALIFLVVALIIGGLALTAGWWARKGKGAYRPEGESGNPERPRWYPGAGGGTGMGGPADGGGM